jgi:hypothetical protein
VVGATGFEPATSRSQSGRSSQAELRPGTEHAGDESTELRYGSPRMATQPREILTYRPARPRRPHDRRLPADKRVEMRERVSSRIGHARGCSSMVEPQSSKLITRVRFPSSPPMQNGPPCGVRFALSRCANRGGGIGVTIPTALTSSPARLNAWRLRGVRWGHPLQ